MAKIRQPFPKKDPAKWLFFCPGCECSHQISTDIWTFNGDVEKPTIRASVLCNPGEPDRICHSFVTLGRIKFLNDCYHALAGQEVELPEVEE